MPTTYLHAVRRFNRDVRLYLTTAALIGFTVDGGIFSVLFNLYLLRLGYHSLFLTGASLTVIGTLIFAAHFHAHRGKLGHRKHKAD
ncbi:MAG: hypothetical protein O7E52_28295 [Candidatus Poribacteria bacterium]|nr:hypothetical protein [Candidatus Poribacteria bacterium]